MFLNRTWLNYIIKCDRNIFICLGPRSSSIELKSKYMAIAIASKFSRFIKWESMDQIRKRIDSKVISRNLAPNLSST